MSVDAVAPGAMVKPELASAADTSFVGSPPKSAFDVSENALDWHTAVSLLVRLTV